MGPLLLIAPTASIGCPLSTPPAPITPPTPTSDATAASVSVAATGDTLWWVWWMLLW